MKIFCATLRDEKYFAQPLLTEKLSTYTPIGVVHRLAFFSRDADKFDLELVKVPSGGYPGEDDNVRFEDTYGRA